MKDKRRLEYIAVFTYVSLWRGPIVHVSGEYDYKEIYEVFNRGVFCHEFQSEKHCFILNCFFFKAKFLELKFSKLMRFSNAGVLWMPPPTALLAKQVSDIARWAPQLNDEISGDRYGGYAKKWYSIL